MKSRGLFRFYQSERLVRINFDVAATGVAAALLAVWPYLGATEGAARDQWALLVMIAVGFVGVFEFAVYTLVHRFITPLRRGRGRRGLGSRDRGRAFFGDRSLGWTERASFTGLAYGLGAAAMYFALALGLHRGLALGLAFSAGMVFARAAHAMWLLHRRALSLYQQRRVININVNLVASGMLAIALAKPPVALLDNWFPEEHPFLFTVLSGVIDATIDVMLYFGFHWLANHTRPVNRRKTGPVPASRPKRGRGGKSFFKDATLVQFERLMLSPLYYFVSLGLMYLLIRLGADRSWAFVAGFATAVLVTRVVHTIVGLRTGTFRDDRGLFGGGDDDEPDGGPGADGPDEGEAAHAASSAASAPTEHDAGRASVAAGSVS